MKCVEHGKVLHVDLEQVYAETQLLAYHTPEEQSVLQIVCALFHKTPTKSTQLDFVLSPPQIAEQCKMPLYNLYHIV